MPPFPYVGQILFEQKKNPNKQTQPTTTTKTHKTKEKTTQLK